MSRTALAIALAVLSASALAGCADKLSSASKGGLSASANAGAPDFKLTPATGDANTIFTLDASALAGTGLKFTWDFGDGKSAEGASVTHRYGFTNGLMTVTLTVEDERTGASAAASHTLTLGTGVNAAPVPKVNVSKDWVEVRQSFHLSAAGTTDADGDPLSYFWTYQILAPASSGSANKSALSALTNDKTRHGGDEGTGSVQPGVNYVIPGRGPEVNFSLPDPGEYAVKVIVSDPKAGNASATLHMAATASIPSKVFEAKYTGSLKFGTQGAQQVSFQDFQQTGSNDDIDGHMFGFLLQYPGTTTIDATWADKTGSGDIDLYVYELVKGAPGKLLGKTEKRDTKSDKLTVELPKGTYGLFVQAFNGASIDFTSKVHADLHVTPQDLLGGK